MKTHLAVICYSRPLHLVKVLDALDQCPELDSLDVRIFCDGPRSNAEHSVTNEVREVADRWLKHHRGCLISRDTNFGLARSVVEAVTSLAGSNDAVIVVEDDIVVTPGFLGYQLEALRRYKDQRDVYAVSGFRHLPPDPYGRVIALPLGSSWGWSTWGRAWKHFDSEAIGWPRDPANPIRHEFDFDGSYPYSALLDGRLAGDNSSWAVLWQWTIYCQKATVIYPPVSLVSNIGFDGSGSHCRDESPTLFEAPAAPDLRKWLWPSQEDINLYCRDPRLRNDLRNALRALAGHSPRRGPRDGPAQETPNTPSAPRLTNHTPFLSMLHQLISRFFRSAPRSQSDDPPIDPDDPYDKAYLWAWKNPDLRELVRLCYKTPDFADNARRFAVAEEFRETERLVRSAFRETSARLRLLDFGCGNGVASYAFARFGFEVVGWDSSLGLLAGIRAAEKLIGLDGVEFDVRMHSGECINVPANSFDIIYMREVLHHIRDLDAFLAEVVRVLRPGGLLVCLRDVVIWSEDQRQSFFRDHPLNHITQDEGCYYLQEYLDAFARAGFETFRLLKPSDSQINAYPNRLADSPPFSEEAARQRRNGYDLFSFFLRKPNAP